LTKGHIIWHGFEKFAVVALPILRFTPLTRLYRHVSAGAIFRLV